MQIVLITHFYGPEHIGGTEIFTATLATELQKKHHSVQIICGADWDTARDYKITTSDVLVQGVPVHRLHFNWKKAPDVFRYLYNNPQVEAHLTHFFARQRPDLVHITSCYSLSASVIVAAQRCNIPVVLTATDFWFLCARNTLLRADNSLCDGPADPWQCASCLLANAKVYRILRLVFSERVTRQLLRGFGGQAWLTNQRGLRGMHGDWATRVTFLIKTLSQVDHIVTASRFLKDLFVAYGVPSEKISVSSYGLDTIWAKGHETKTPSSLLRLGFIGQMLPMKGPDLLLQAVRQIKLKVPLAIKLYGDITKNPAYGVTLRQLAMGDARIQFLGTFDNSKMGEVLSEIDVLVVPSIWYDFPLVISSALATHTPVLATNLPGMNELITHNVNGLLFERNNIPSLVEQIERLLTEPNLITRLRQGISPIKTAAEMTTEYCALYMRVLALRHSTAKK